jgi:hypothetical protein
MAQIFAPELSLRAAPQSSARALRVAGSYSLIVTCRLRFSQSDSLFNNPFSISPGWIFGNNFTYTVELWEQKINFLAQLNDPNRNTFTKLASRWAVVKPTTKNFQGLEMKEKTEFITSTVFTNPVLAAAPGESVYGVIRLINNTTGAAVTGTTNLRSM